MMQLIHQVSFMRTTIDIEDDVLAAAEELARLQHVSAGQIVSKLLRSALTGGGAQGIVIDKVYFCPSHPEHGVGKCKVDSPFRKPGPGMILQVAEEFDVDLARSVVVGDKETDIQAGVAAGVGCNLLYLPLGSVEEIETAASAAVSRLVDAGKFFEPGQIG